MPTDNPNSQALNINPNILFDDMIKTLTYNQSINSYYIRVFQEIQKDGIPTLSPYLKDNKDNINSQEDKYLKEMMDKNKISTTTKDVVSEDNYELILYQNTMYIAGTIACASLIIGAVILSRNE
jgi:hypothetical protein